MLFILLFYSVCVHNGCLLSKLLQSTLVLMEGLEGVDIGLEASKPESVIRSRQYFI
jgi:hypothetical protein